MIVKTISNKTLKQSPILNSSCFDCCFVEHYEILQPQTNSYLKPMQQVQQQSLNLKQKKTKQQFTTPQMKKISKDKESMMIMENGLKQYQRLSFISHTRSLNHSPIQLTTPQQNNSPVILSTRFTQLKPNTINCIPSLPNNNHIQTEMKVQRYVDETILPNLLRQQSYANEAESKKVYQQLWMQYLRLLQEYENLMKIKQKRDNLHEKYHGLKIQQTSLRQLTIIREQQLFKLKEEYYQAIGE